MASSFTKVTDTDAHACERWGCDREIPAGGDHHVDSRTGKRYCLSNDCRGVLSADFAALGNAVGRLIGAPVVRGLGKDDDRTAAVAAALVADLDLGSLPIYVAPVKAKSADEQAAERIAALEAQIAALTAAQAVGEAPKAARVVSAGKRGK